MRSRGFVEKMRQKWLILARLVRARLQHELNAVHVYCRLSGLIGSPHALQFARSWENNRLYTHVLYGRRG